MQEIMKPKLIVCINKENKTIQIWGGLAMEK